MSPYFQNYLCIIWLIVCAYENRDIKINALKPYKECARNASVSEDRLAFKG